MASNEDTPVDISVEEKDKLVAEIIRYILFKTHQTAGCPIKREELTQIVTKNYHQRNLPAVVINEAKVKLSSIFGYEMRELQRTRVSSNRSARASQQSSGDAKSYIIISELSPDIYSNFVENKGASHLNGFAFVVISIVHLSGGKISEENLWRQLKRMGLDEKDERRTVLGSSEQALELLVQQRYLQKEKISGPEGNVMTYELAERALEESVRNKLQEYIAQVVTANSDAAEHD